MPTVRYISALLDDYNIDIIGISEHWLFPNSLNFLQTLHTGYDGVGVCSSKSDPFTSHHRGQGGVALMYKKKLSSSITTIDIDDDRICGINVKFPDGRIVKIIMVYMPSSNYGIADYSNYIEKLYDIYQSQLNEECECIIMGDFNCELVGHKCNKGLSPRGKILSQFLEDTASLSVNLRDICTGPKYTFDPLDTHQNTTMIDHILIEACRYSWVKGCKIIDEDDNPSDHLPVMLELYIPTVERITVNDAKTLKWKRYTCEEIHGLYTSNLEKSLESISYPIIENASIEIVESYYDDLVHALKSCALQNIKQSTYVPHFKPYWNKTLKELHNNMIAKRKVWLAEQRPRDEAYSHLEYKNAKRLFRKEMRNMQNNWYEKQYEEMENVAEIDQNHFWKLVKRMNKKGPKKTYEIKFDGKICKTSEDIASGWAGYFTKLYSHLEEKHFDEDFKRQIENKLSELKKKPVAFSKILDSEITETEVTDAISKLKLGKAGGNDGLTNEHLKYGGPHLVKHLAHLFSLMMQIMKIPSQMKSGLTITLLKPGKKIKTDPDSYRGITLLQVIYKLFEKITLKRMQVFLNRGRNIFPDPLQYAYQEKLSSINATLGITETIKYNTERGSKVFVCMLDNRKAFDIVWHSGLFFHLHELGINGKLWHLILDAYTDMSSTVFHKGFKSKSFKLFQSTRQGSIWGSLFFLIVINPLILELRNLGIGAYVGNIFSGIHVQADDVALVATTYKHLQIMMAKVYEYSCKWRFILHPEKTKVLVFNEPLHHSNLNSKEREWYVGEHKCLEVDSHIHCGVTLTSASSSIFRTKNACRKGRGVMLSIINMLQGSKVVNPLTCLKLYKSVVLPSATFGCELWLYLNETEKLMIERMQRYCAKVIQHLGKRTHSYICCPMLGMTSMESYIDAVKLRFLRRILTLPSHCTSKRIIVQRLFQAQLMPDSTHGYAGEIVALCDKYNLKPYLDNFLKYLTIPDKLPWKYIIRDAIKEKEVDKFKDATRGDPDFKRFAIVHPNPLLPSPIWRLAKRKRFMLPKCFQVAKALAYPHISQMKILCEYCGKLSDDALFHYIIDCYYVQDERETFWQMTTDILGVEAASYLYNLYDDQLLEVMFGGPSEFFTDYDHHISFLSISVNYMTKVFGKINIFLDL